MITDARVETPHATAVVGSLAESGGEVDLLVIEEGETSKSVAAADMLWQKMLDLGADRKTVVVAVGGGVVGDLAGFVAATYAPRPSALPSPTTLWRRSIARWGARPA